VTTWQCPQPAGALHQTAVAGHLRRSGVALRQRGGAADRPTRPSGSTGKAGPVSGQGRVKVGNVRSDLRRWPTLAPARRLNLPHGSCLQGQHRPSAQVKVTWRFDAPDSTAMSTPRRSSSLAASTQLRGLHDNFDAALRQRLAQRYGRDDDHPEGPEADCTKLRMPRERPEH
jgi:hypothetical protein